MLNNQIQILIKKKDENLTDEDINKPITSPGITIGTDRKNETKEDKKPINPPEKTNNQEKNQSFFSKHKRTLITSALFVVFDVCLIIAANQAKLFSKIYQKQIFLKKSFELKNKKRFIYNTIKNIFHKKFDRKFALNLQKSVSYLVLDFQFFYQAQELKN